MTVSDEIIKVLNAFSKKIGLTIDWTQNNILPYMQKLCDKYITYEMTTSIFWIIIGICLLILGIYCIKKCKYYWMKEEEKKKKGKGDTAEAYDANVTGFVFACAATACILFGVAIIIFHILNIITCVTFPEKKILKELQTVYKSLK